MAQRLMKQITVYIHQAGAKLMYVDRKTDEAESSLLHLLVTNKLRQAASHTATEDYSLLKCDTLYSGRSVPKFWPWR